MFPFLSRKKTITTSPSWWQSALSSKEQETIEGAFQPLGNISAEALVASGNPSSIGNLVGHLKQEALRQLGYKLLDHADSLVTEDVSVLDLHFYWGARGGFYYRWRDYDGFALEEAAQSFQRQIGLAENAVRVFKEDKAWGFIPAHAGYRQLRIIEEKRGNLTLARALCEQAKLQGWADDWDKNIARLNKKIAKQTAI
jgi:hypothetical protein